MARINVPMRLFFLLSLSVSLTSITGCNRTEANNRRNERDEIDLNQNVTVRGKPQDAVFKDFEKNWRKFISNAPQLAVAVVGTAQPPPVEPLITSECVFSSEAKGYVPQITISWNEPPSPITEMRARLRQQTQQAQSEGASMRLDLGVNYDAFARNYYSSILSTDKLQRFSLPSNSALVNNPNTVILTGPGLFPKLMDFRTQPLQDPATNRRFEKQTVVLREVSEGIAYTMRVSQLSGNNWNADRQLVFTAPVCPNSF